MSVGDEEADLTVSQCAELSGSPSYHTVARAIRTGRLSARKHKGRYLVRRGDYLRWLADRSGGGEGGAGGFPARSYADRPGGPGYRTILRAIRRGELPAVRQGSAHLIEPSDYGLWLISRQQDGRKAAI